MLSQRQIDDIVRDFKSLALDIDNGVRLSEPRLSDRDWDELVAMRLKDLAAAKVEASRWDFDRAKLALETMIARRRLVLNEFERRQLGQALMMAGIDVMETSLKRLGGDVSDLISEASAVASTTERSVEQQPEHRVPTKTKATPQQPQETNSLLLSKIAAAMGTSLKRLGLDITDRLSEASAAASTTELSVEQQPEHRIRTRTKAPPQQPQESSSPLLSKVAAEFLSHQRNGRIWDEQTLRQAQKTFELTQEIVSDRPIREYGRSEANRVKDTLQALPADYGKAALFRGLTAPAIIDLDRERTPAVERLSLRTVKRHLSVLSALWKWVIREGTDIPNPFLGFSFPSMKRANEQRDMWNTEDLKELFASPIWTGCKSAARRSEPGDLIIRDEKFWLPLIALFSGMRQEEICQLQVEDIRTVDGFVVFDLNARGARRLKNKNAIRKVPVHAELIRIGLLKFVEDHKLQGSKSLFPDLSPGGADDRLGHAFSKWFARYRQAIGVYRKGLDFHSLRHTATTLLHRAGVAGPIIDELTGHATPGETARYTKGTSMRQLVAAIDSMLPEIDLSRLHITPSEPPFDTR